MRATVLVHGLFGYGGDKGGIILPEYFKGVRDMLTLQGIMCFEPHNHASGSIKRRGRDLDSYIINEVLAKGYESVDIIAHSMGGLDSRFLASPRGLNRGEYINSITTLGSPHQGSTLADIALRLFPNTHIESVIGKKPVKLIERSYQWALGKVFSVGGEVTEIDLEYFEQLIGLNREGLRDVSRSNRAYLNGLIDHPEVDYFSVVANRKRPTLLRDHAFNITHKMLMKREGENDGLVSVTSQTHGEVLMTVDANHTEIIGMGIGPYNHLPIYDTIAEHVLNRR